GRSLLFSKERPKNDRRTVDERPAFVRVWQAVGNFFLLVMEKSVSLQSLLYKIGTKLIML
ncbi:MAG: hypothetical protein IK010_08180, partial [Bacteroidales bacterium]|nr:hypothetical protein [Bacteroidales bacterium]